MGWLRRWGRLGDRESANCKWTTRIVNNTGEIRIRRRNWVDRLGNPSGSFEVESYRLVDELRDEIAVEGSQSLLDHLRICGAVPERYRRDSSEEKLYSKYTDAVVSEALNAIGLNSVVLDTRADSADVQARASNYTLVADAKAFRLTRTAKNQKDFKVQAMDDWRGGLDFALVVGPIYQYMSRTSQIYLQAINRNVCLLSYTHLACLVNLADKRGTDTTESALHTVLKTVNLLHPSKNAVDYWTGINRALIDSLTPDVESWEAEKQASMVGLDVARDESLEYLRAERNRLLGLSHRQALDELVRLSGIDSRIRRVESVGHGELLGVE